MRQITKGPLPVEDAADNYAVGLYNNLRDKRGWREDVFILLRQEYASIVWAVIAQDFGVRTMWEFASLVQVTNHYLRDRQSQFLSFQFYRKVGEDLATISAQFKGIQFDEQEMANMHRAFKRMAPIIRGWKATVEEARE